MKNKIIFILPFLLLVSCQGKVTSQIAKYNGGDVIVEEIQGLVTKTPLDNVKTSITGEALKKVKFTRDTNDDVKKAYDDRKKEIETAQKSNMKTLLKTYRANNLDEVLDLIHLDTTVASEVYSVDYFTKNLSTEEKLKTFYDSLVDEIQVSHILISTTDGTSDADALAKAQKLINDMKDLKDAALTTKFTENAKTHSKDSGSASKGGDVGKVGTYSDFVPEFKEASLKLKKGEMTLEPVKTQYGYHIILATNVETKLAFEGNEAKFKKDFYKQSSKTNTTIPNFILAKLHSEVKIDIKDETIKKDYEAFIKKSLEDYEKSAK